MCIASWPQPGSPIYLAAKDSLPQRIYKQSSAYRPVLSNFYDLCWTGRRKVQDRTSTCVTLQNLTMTDKIAGGGK